jgi:hypothetical protein
MMMSQQLLPGFPHGAIRVGSRVSILSKDGRVTYFIDSDNFFSHPEGDRNGQRFAIAALLSNRHMRLRDLEASELGIPRRTVQHWIHQFETDGPDSFFAPPGRRGPLVMTDEVRAKCTQLLAENLGIREIGRRLNIDESTLRKAISRGAVERPDPSAESQASVPDEAQTKSERSRQDAEAAAGMGTACNRADERIAAALGLVDGAVTRHETCADVMMGGVLAGLPVLCGNGLLSGVGKYLSLPKGYYSVVHILITLGFMALCRIRRPEGLRHVPPGELGKTIGLDRAPEVKTLREKIALMADQGEPTAWMKDLARTWMEDDPTEAGYLYVDGHVRVYHGSETLLPRRYVSREKLCLRGTTDYWVNDALGMPFFAVSKAVTDGLASTILNEIVPDLLPIVPGQPSELELAANPLLHRFVIIFDREGSSHSLFSKLWENRIGAITYRKAVKDCWPEGEFQDVEVPIPGGGVTTMSLAFRESTLSAGSSRMPILEVRRLTKTKHQVAIITTARTLNHPVIAGRMFARWCQENYFAYMMEHYDIDGLVQYGGEDLPGSTEVVNPTWRTLDKAVRDKCRELRNLRAEIGAMAIDDKAQSIQVKAEQLQDLQQIEADLNNLRAKKRATPRKVPISSLPQEERPRQLLPLAKTLTDTVKMIAYRAETALVNMLRPHLAKEEEARAIIRELFVSAADLEPNEATQTLTVRIHRMACPAHDRAIAALLEQLTQAEFTHPETGMRMTYALV